MKILVAGKIPSSGIQYLNEKFNNVVIHDSDVLITKEQLIEKIQDVDALISLLSTNVDKDVIDSAPNLKIIANYGAGFNNIDIDYARSKHIDVTNTPTVSTNATADLTMAILLAVARRVVEGDNVCRTIGFNGWAPLFFRGREVSGKTIGIIGLGEIGTAVARRAKAFDMDIIYSGPARYEDKEKELNAKHVSLDTLLQTADFVAINCSYHPSMKHMISTNELNLMKPTAYLINASRGPIVHEEALAQALENNVIEGAALDVFENEPLINERLKRLSNVVLTPHIGNATFETRDKMAEIVTTNVFKKLNGQQPDYIVN